MSIKPKHNSRPCYRCCKDFLEMDKDLEMVYCPSCGFIMGNQNEINASHFLETIEVSLNETDGYDVLRDIRNIVLRD